MKKALEMARALIPAALEAGAIEMRYFHEGAKVMNKDDGSPVTLADQEAEKIIAAALYKLCPHVPMVGEESVADGNIPDISGGEFFLVDPLDGTREFIAGGDGFTVNIAYMKDFKPVMGLIYIPTSDTLYYGAEGEAYCITKGGKEERISVRAIPEEGMTVLLRKMQEDPKQMEIYLQDKKVNDIAYYSSSLKFCAVAAGKADMYPRLDPTCEWDTAAGEAILRAAGGRVLTMEGQDMPYGKKDKKFLNPSFVAQSF